MAIERRREARAAALDGRFANMACRMAIERRCITWFIWDFVRVPDAGITALAYAMIWVPNRRD